ncbi:MAG: hypothetical protein DRO14_01330 [Thermoprotei archaeon]|nr:MAG: hypothetical protein DRO14_01330 [Thermoprotei archaeon]
MPPRVASYMSSPVITASKNDNLAYIRNLMIRHKVSKIVIVDNGNVIGMISRSDFIRVVFNKRRYIKPLTNILAYEIMTSPVYAIQPGRTIKAAAQAMLKRNIGSLLVLDKNGKLQGIITRTDLVRAYAERYYGCYKVADFMTDKVPTVHVTHSLYYVIDLMQETGLGKAVVVEGNKPIGVITKVDIAFLNIPNLIRGGSIKYYKRPGYTGRRFEGIVRLYTIPLAGDLMTPDPITVRPEEDLAIAADIMVKNGIGTLPVTNSDGDLVGLLTKKDVIKALRRL